MFKVVYLKDGVNADYRWFESFKLAIEFASTLEEKQILEIKKYDNHTSDV
jgi:hypothetical protein